MSDQSYRQLGDYRLGRLLGEGNFGDVYLSEHPLEKRPVAVKVLKVRLTPETIKGFLAEARVVRLQHPHILQLLDFDVDKDIPFLVMEYAPYGTLRQRHPQGSHVPLPTVCSYVKQIADALQYAHEKRLIHRDVKPQNMLIGAEQQILVSDFGVAVVAHSEYSLATQNMAGTVPYMAPEQLQGKPRPASDQYALGIMVYEWLCGVRPFEGPRWEVMGQHLTASPPPLSEKEPTISATVEAVVMKALSKDPHDRFVDVRTFALALEQAANQQAAAITIPPSNSTTLVSVSEPGVSSSSPQIPEISRPLEARIDPGQPEEQIAISSRKEHPGEQRSSFLSKRLSRRMVVGGGVALLVAGGSLVWWIGTRARMGTSARMGTRALPIGTLLSTYKGHSNGVQTVAWSPDGGRIVSGGLDKTVQVWNAADGSHLYTYQGHSAVVAAVAWSPDGKHIASGSWDKTVQVWNATDGSYIYTYHGHSILVDTVAWSPDDRRIASGSGDDTVQVWNAIDGSHPYTYKGHSSGVQTVAWSPDGKRIVSGGLDRTVQVWNAADGSHLYTYQGHSAVVAAVAWSPDGKHIASGSWDRTVQVWNAADGSQASIYRGHSSAVFTVAWSPDGKRIASGGLDRTAQVWNAVDGSQAYIYRGHSNSVNAVAWSPNGKRIASGGADGTVQVWTS